MPGEINKYIKVSNYRVILKSIYDSNNSRLDFPENVAQFWPIPSIPHFLTFFTFMALVVCVFGEGEGGGGN